MKSIISKILVVSMLCTVCVGCSNISFNANVSASVGSDEGITTETPYYYVTNGQIIKERNHYMELEVKIPKIEYSNKEEDPVFDPINVEIENTILKLVDESKKSAYDTYKKYLETAKTNLENDRLKQIEDLKIKYKNILTDDEVKAIHEVMDEDVFDIATESFLAVDGFASTEEILNAGPHNKKIIVVEKNIDQVENEKNSTEAAVNDNANLDVFADGLKKASIRIDGKPGRVGGDKGAISQNEKNIESDIGEIKNNDISTSTQSVTIDENIDVKKDFDKVNREKREDMGLGKANFKKGFAKNIASDSYIAKQIREHLNELPNSEISKENFYKELAKLRRFRTPNDFLLTTSYNPMYIYCDFDVKCLDEDYISIYINMYETRNQSISKVLFYNIDLKQKKILAIKDVLGEEYKDICINSINKAIENWSEDKKALLSNNRKIDDFITDDTTFFINNNHIPVVVFDKYAITAGAAGYPEFQIVK